MSFTLPEGPESVDARLRALSLIEAQLRQDHAAANALIDPSNVPELIRTIFGFGLVSAGLVKAIADLSDGTSTTDSILAGLRQHMLEELDE